MGITRRTMKVSELKAAPGELAVLQDFVNTADRFRGTDLLTDPRAVEDWLEQAGLLEAGARLAAADVERVVVVREDLRALVAANNGVAPDVAAAERLDRAARLALLRLRVADDGATRLEATAGGLESVFGRLLAVVHDARSAGTWRRLKACAEPSCRAAFHDFSPNLTGTWCSMRRCGGRSKGRAYRRREKRRRLSF